MPKLAVLYDAGQAVLSTFDLDEVLQRILAIARDYFRLPNVAILLIDKEARQFCVALANRLGCGQRQNLFGISRRDHRRLGPQETARLFSRRHQRSSLYLRRAVHALGAGDSAHGCDEVVGVPIARATRSTASTMTPSNC